MAGAMLIVICYSACYVSITKNIKKKAEVKNLLTDRYLLYLEENCSITNRGNEQAKINEEDKKGE